MRETRPPGSVRGVRSNPYPYRDTLTPAAVGSVHFIDGFDLDSSPGTVTDARNASSFLLTVAATSQPTR